MLIEVETLQLTLRTGLGKLIEEEHGLPWNVWATYEKLLTGYELIRWEVNRLDKGQAILTSPLKRRKLQYVVRVRPTLH